MSFKPIKYEPIIWGFVAILVFLFNLYYDSIIYSLSCIATFLVFTMAFVSISIDKMCQIRDKIGD